MPLEGAEVGKPAVDLTGGQEHLAQVLVGGGVPRVDGQHIRVSGDRRLRIGLLLEQHAEIEIGGDEIGLERERPLIRTRGALRVTLHLQRDAVIEMRVAISGRMNEHVPECLLRRGAIAQREMRMTKHAQERDIARRALEAFAQRRNGVPGVASFQRQVRAFDPRFGKFRCCGTAAANASRARSRSPCARATTPRRCSAGAKSGSAVRTLSYPAAAAARSPC